MCQCFGIHPTASMVERAEDHERSPVPEQRDDELDFPGPRAASRLGCQGVVLVGAGGVVVVVAIDPADCLGL